MKHHAKCVAFIRQVTLILLSRFTIQPFMRADFNANIGYYTSSHPKVAHVPIGKIVNAFKDGINKDSGLLESHLPDLTTVMSQLPNSRQQWFNERLGIEAISRDLGSPNLFVTVNLDPRAWPDVRKLLYELEHGGQTMERVKPFHKVLLNLQNSQVNMHHTWQYTYTGK